MCRSIRPALLSLIIALTVIRMASGAPGQPSKQRFDRVASVEVPYQDLDLRKDADAKAMLARLQRAAVTACGGNPSWHPAFEVMPRRTVAVFQECRRNAIARAVAQIDAPALSRVFVSVYGQPATPFG